MTDAERQVIDRVKEFAPAIHQAAQERGLPPEVLAGLACQESAGIPWATRHEPAYRWLVANAPRPRLMSKDTDTNGQKTSWGLCQVMGAVARERGFDGWFAELCQPHLGLKYGAAHLAWWLRRNKQDLAKALSCYNTGDPENGKAYANKVLRWAELYTQEHNI